LLIDDDLDEYDMVIEAIKKIDTDVEVFFLDRFENCKNYRNHEFDLILLDINMPHNDGFTWLKKIREKNQNIPVIMYSNSSNPANITRAYQDGATLFFNKPDSFFLLIKGIGKLLTLDWNNPFAITNEYVHNGKYSTFQVA
jgi:DNA-binding NtrC family response regulator